MSMAVLSWLVPGKHLLLVTFAAKRWINSSLLSTRNKSWNKLLLSTTDQYRLQWCACRAVESLVNREFKRLVKKSFCVCLMPKITAIAIHSDGFNNSGHMISPHNCLPFNYFLTTWMNKIKPMGRVERGFQDWSFPIKGDHPANLCSKNAPELPAVKDCVYFPVCF